MPRAVSRDTIDASAVQPPSRRAVLAGFAVVTTAVAPSLSAAASHPEPAIDPQLTALLDDYSVAVADSKEPIANFTAAEEAAFDAERAGLPRAEAERLAGLPEAEAAQEAADDAVLAAQDAILEYHPKSWTDLVAKTRSMQTWCEDARLIDGAEALLRDILAVADGREA